MTLIVMIMRVLLLVQCVIHVAGFHSVRPFSAASVLSSSTTPSPTTVLHALDPTSSIQLASELSLQNKDVLVFIAGVIPFAWATVEFWRRIAVGEPFGTGRDSVYIGKDNAPSESRGRQTLDKGAFAVAYVLFTIAAGAIGLTLYSVVTSSAPPESLGGL